MHSASVSYGVRQCFLCAYRMDESCLSLCCHSPGYQIMPHKRFKSSGCVFYAVIVRLHHYVLQLDMLLLLSLLVVLHQNRHRQPYCCSPQVIHRSLDGPLFRRTDFLSRRNIFLFYCKILWVRDLIKPLPMTISDQNQLRLIAFQVILNLV